MVFQRNKDNRSHIQKSIQVNMASELVREAKRATELPKNNKRLDGVKTEIEFVLRMTRQFQDEEGAFKFVYERTRSQMLEFVK